MTLATAKQTAEWILSLLTTVGVVLIASGSPLLGVKTTTIITLVTAVLTAVARFLQTGTPPSPTSATPPAPPVA
jgi:hypothetical protein